MVRLDKYRRELPEEEPCVSLEELFEIWNRIIVPNYSRVLESKLPEVARYRRYFAHRLDNFEKAIKAWSIGLRRSRYPGVGLWEGIQEVFGYRHPYFYYYMRWLGLLATTKDIAAVFGTRKRSDYLKKLKRIEEGYLYFLTKAYFTGSYEEKRSFEYQIESSFTIPLDYDDETKKLCVDFDYMRKCTFNALSSSDLDENLVNVMESEVSVYGVKIDFTGISWDFERYKTARYCYVGIQKQNLYGSYWVYEYYLWFLREPYPSNEIEWVSNTHGGVVRRGRRYTCYITPIPETYASTILDADGKTWVEEEATETVESYIRRQEEEAEVIRYVYERE